MKNNLEFYLIPIFLIAVIFLNIMIQRWKTRQAMEQFAKKYGMTYMKKSLTLLGTGEIQGIVSGSKFSMGMMSMDYSPENDERDLSYKKYQGMHIAWNRGTSKYQSKFYI
ncbi:MAG: hypothetical protein JW944_16430 [Deltaproteobacteria bacterium]|nr:hypothetical protein [Deltaproteobacteria bacterium]